MLTLYRFLEKLTLINPENFVKFLRYLELAARFLSDLLCPVVIPIRSFVHVEAERLL